MYLSKNANIKSSCSS